MTNQWLKQIPPHIGWYFAGFADGEGSFNVSLRRKDYSVGWQLCPSFNVSQRDITVLALYKRWLKCGTLRTRQDGVVYYEVISIPALKEVILPFFEKYNFLSASKKKNFSIFRKINPERVQLSVGDYYYAREKTEYDWSRGLPSSILEEAKGWEKI